MVRTISEVDVISHANGDVWMYQNRKNKAHFTVSEDGNVFYQDSLGNYMASSPRRIRINFELFELQNYGDEIRKPDGTRMIMLPKAEIQDIANKTFYADGQFHAIDFLTYVITEEK